MTNQQDFVLDRLSHGMTVDQLIEELQTLSELGCGNQHVVFSVGYGDYCNTTQALPVESVRELENDETIKKTAYSNSELAVEERDEDEYTEDERFDYEEDEDQIKVIVLS